MLEDYKMKNSNYIIAGPKFNGRNVGGTTALFSDVCAALKNRNIRVINTSRKNKFSLIFIIICMILFRIKYLRKKPKIILFSSYDWKLYLPILILLFGYKAICLRMFGGDFHLQLKVLPKFIRIIFIYLLKKIKIITVETQLSADHLKIFYGLNNIIISRNGRFVKSNNILKYNARKRNCIFAGRITKEKGYYDILELAKSIPDTEFWMIGPIDSNLDTSNIPNNVKLQGEQSRHEIEKSLSQSLIAIFPSNHLGEGLPGFLIECQMQGVPVVAYDWLAVSEAFQNGRTGMLIKNNSLKDFLNAVKKLQKKDVWNMMSANGLMFSKYNFDIIKISEELIKCVDS
jgi:glycosyltransferase involved in cell wall biosynthesis